MDHFTETDVAFAAYWNEHLVGKTILRAEPVDTHCPVNEVRIWFTDGSYVTIQSEHDEGFVASGSPTEGPPVTEDK